MNLIFQVNQIRNFFPLTLCRALKIAAYCSPPVQACGYTKLRLSLSAFPHDI